MNMKKLEYEKIKELYQDSEAFEKLAEVTRAAWISKKLFPPDMGSSQISHVLDLL